MFNPDKVEMVLRNLKGFNLDLLRNHRFEISQSEFNDFIENFDKLYVFKLTKDENGRTTKYEIKPHRYVYE